MADLARLKEAVARIEDRGDALIELVKGLAEEIRASANDPAELNALADRLEAEADEISAAVDENTAEPSL